MKNRWKRLISASLALVLAGSLALPALGAETLETPAEPGEEVTLFDVTAGRYSPPITVQPGGLYTLIALPSAMNPPQVLTAGDLVKASGNALFIGSATANAQGKLTFEDVRLRTAQAAVYYVTGPGLTTPYREATGLSTSAEGVVRTASQDSSAVITLVDKETDYRYNTGVQSDSSGYYTTGHLAPGKYKLQVNKPGYLPYLSTKETDYLDVTSGESVYQEVDISANVGDVNGDGARNMADLAALLTYYGKTAPQGITADLDYSGAVDAKDAALLAPYLTTGTQTNVTGASITVQDDGGSGDATLRYLSFELDTTATVSAAAFSLTFRRDAVQPLTAQGGLMSPVDGGSLASCLVCADGFASSLTSWKVDGDLITLSFAVTSNTPRAAGQVARFYYRPATGSTESFYQGVFSLTHAAALVGKNTVVTQSSLTYPNCQDIHIDSLTIDQAPAPGQGPLTLQVPASGQTTAMVLSATGHAGATSYPDFAGLTWTVTDAQGNAPTGVRIERSILTIGPEAAEGTVRVVASRNNVQSDPLNIQLQKEKRTLSSVKILKDSTVCEQDELIFSIADSDTATYTAQTYDQYGVEIASSDPVTWSLSGAPVGLSISGGVLRSDWDKLTAGTYTFTVRAQVGTGLQATVTVRLTVEASLGALIITGPSSATLPASPQAGDDPLTLSYTISALDQRGRPMDLSSIDPSFTISPAGNGVDARKEVGGYTVAISPPEGSVSQAGRYTLTAQSGDVTASFTLELLDPNANATRAVIFYKDEAVQDLSLPFTSDVGGTRLSRDIPFSAKLLDAKGQLATEQSDNWTWSISPAHSNVRLLQDKASVTMKLDSLHKGSYPFVLTATETKLGLSVTAHVTVTVVPRLYDLSIDGDQGLFTIPTGQNLTYTYSVTARDADGDPIPLPDDLVWTLDTPDGREPKGVSLDNGVLTVTPDAVPGSYALRVSSKGVEAFYPLRLESSTPHESIDFQLYSRIEVDGKEVQSLGATNPNWPDMLDIKEGQRAVITYTPMWVNRTTGTATPADLSQIQWRGSEDGKVVFDEKTQCGVYDTICLAIYDGPDHSQTLGIAAAIVSVYPDIRDLRLDFGEGYKLEPPYTLTVPSGKARTYTADLVATILRGGEKLQVPLKDLGLTYLSGYALDTTCYYTGVQVALDKDADQLRFTVEPTAIQNSMAPPASGQPDTRVLGLTFRYMHGVSLKLPDIPFYLSQETLVIQNASLRRGVGSVQEFVFDTPREDKLTLPAGTLTNCYALELLDQYNRPLTDQGDVTWTLTGSPKNAQNDYLITMAEASPLVERAYSTYASIRRLRINAATPPGTYPLTLSAACGEFKRTLGITLVVTQAETTVDQVLLSEGGQLTIPRHYYYYNKPTPLNDEINSFPFTFTLLDKNGRELDPLGYNISWSVTDPNGSAPAGVAVSPSDKNPCNANVKVDRTAKPTGSGSGQGLRVTATAKTSGGVTVGSGSSTLQLVRAAPVPTLMELRKDGQTITEGSITAGTSQDYTFRLLDQYGQPVDLSFQKQVTWTLLNAQNSGATIQVFRNSNQVPSVRVTVPASAKSANMTLTAAFPLAGTGDNRGVFAAIPLRITAASTTNPGGNGGGGGGGGGGGNDDTDTSTAGPPAKLTISGGTTLSTTQGTATTKTFSATLKDAKGLTCALSYSSKVTWSASGLSGGITFNASTRVLSVPATVAPGTYKVTITAVYNASSTVRQSLAVTITVKAKEESTAPTDVTLAPPVVQNGTQGTATLTTAQEQALLATTGVSGGTVSIIPTGGSGVTSLTVTLTSATASAIASQRGQSLRIQTNLGTVVLSPESVRALATRGGSNTSITLSTTANGLKVDFACGSSAGSLPGVITLNGVASGNVALQVNADGSETLLKKALVQEGKIYTYLTGSTQLKLETRSPNFVDTQGHWAKSAIDFTAARDLFQGTSATTFDPGGQMTRAMVVTVLHRLENTPASASTARFADVPQDSWYTAAVSWANAKGIVQGTDNGFKPGDPVTREQLATILYRYVGSLGLSTTNRDNLASFSDRAKVSSWARTAMEWAVGQGLINGKSGGMLDPGGYASRAEVSAILERLIRSMAPVV